MNVCVDPAFAKEIPKKYYVDTRRKNTVAVALSQLSGLPTKIFQKHNKTAVLFLF